LLLAEEEEEEETWSSAAKTEKTGKISKLAPAKVGEPPLQN
jgi:hypothetical protein